MSGGHFEYNQWKIDQIAEDIRSELEHMGKPKSKEELYMSDEWYQKYPEEMLNLDYSEKTKKEFKKAYKILKQAYVYAQRIDWLLSGDDGEETFHKRLKEDLDNLNKKK